MLIPFVTQAIAITFSSWIVGLVLNAICVQFNWYRRLSNFNFIPSKTWNHTLGIAQFSWLITHTFFRFFNQKIAPKGPINAAELHRMRREMTIAEIGHLIGFAFTVIFMGYYVYLGQWMGAGILLVVSLLFNAYPALLQQYHKRKIDRLMARYRA